jgi:hypothetical protein
MSGLLAAIVFCGFGFLASYEPPGFPAVRALYGIMALLGVAGFVLLARQKPPTGS